MDNIEATTSKPRNCALATGSAADKMSPEQIANFRNVLLGMIGPYAMMAPDEDIQFMRDQMNAQFDRPQNARGVPMPKGEGTRNGNNLNQT